jgi:AraC-like DNA-binding protein
MATNPAVFSSSLEYYHADTCEPVVAAARAGAIRLAAVAHGTYPGLKLPGTVLPELRSAGHWDVPREQTWGLDSHRNEGIEFTFLVTGRLGFAVDDKSFQLRPGHLTVTRPWQRHRVGRPNVEASQLIWAILDVGVRRPNQSWTWPSWVVLTPKERDRLSTLLRHNEQPVWKADSHIADDFKKIAQVADGAARRFDSLPERAGEEWTVDSMAEQCGLKRSRFTSYCWQLTNRSPAQYLTQCRAAAAEWLLRKEPQMSILDVALASGFCSSQHFATTYRRIKGQTPREARGAGDVSG